MEVTLQVEGIYQALAKLKIHQTHLDTAFKKEIKNSARAVKYTAKRTMPVAKEGTWRKTKSGKVFTPRGQTKKSLKIKSLEGGYLVSVAPIKRKGWIHPKNGWKRHWVEFGSNGMIPQKGRYVMTNAEKKEKPKFEQRMKRLAKMGLEI